MVSTKKDFIGRVLGGRPGLVDPDRPTLVGFRPVDRSARLRSGAHFVARDATATAAERRGLHDLGRLLTVDRALDRPRLAEARRRSASARSFAPTIRVRGGDILVEVVSPVLRRSTKERRSVAELALAAQSAFTDLRPSEDAAIVGRSPRRPDVGEHRRRQGQRRTRCAMSYVKPMALTLAGSAGTGARARHRVRLVRPRPMDRDRRARRRPRSRSSS